MTENIEKSTPFIDVLPILTMSKREKGINPKYACANLREGVKLLLCERERYSFKVRMRKSERSGKIIYICIQIMYTQICERRR